MASGASLVNRDRQDQLVNAVHQGQLDLLVALVLKALLVREVKQALQERQEIQEHQVINHRQEHALKVFKLLKQCAKLRKPLFYKFENNTSVR